MGIQVEHNPRCYLDPHWNVKRKFGSITKNITFSNLDCKTWLGVNHKSWCITFKICNFSNLLNASFGSMTETKKGTFKKWQFFLLKTLFV